jgi:hypothetical protein
MLGCSKHVFMLLFKKKPDENLFSEKGGKCTRKNRTIFAAQYSIFSFLNIKLIKRQNNKQVSNMNQDSIIDLLNSTKTITILLKAWLFVYQKVLREERFRLCENYPSNYYPFHDTRYKNHFIVPLEVLFKKSYFLNCCEYWFDACCRNPVLLVKMGLRHSGGGLGVVSRIDSTLETFDGEVSGVLEFVSEKLFVELKRLSCGTLYQTREGDFCLMYGVLSLCNNSALLSDKMWPTLVDRDYLSHEELFVNDCDNSRIAPNFKTLLMKHHAIKMHLSDRMKAKVIQVDDQIFVNYLSDNFIDLTL